MYYNSLKSKARIAQKRRVNLIFKQEWRLNKKTKRALILKKCK